MQTIEVDSTGNKRCYWNGILHRVGAPAFEGVGGTKKWFADGIHNGATDPKFWSLLMAGSVQTDPLNGCVVDYYGQKHWFLEGVRHREDGPAIECPSTGIMLWLFHGKSLAYGSEGFWKLWDLLTAEQPRTY